MDNILKFIDSADKYDLNKISKAVKKRSDELEYLLNLNELIPKKFHDYIKKIKFNTNNSDHASYDTFQEIWCRCIIIFGSNCGIEIINTIYSKNDFNSGIPTIKLIIGKDKYFISYVKDGLNYKIEKDILKILDYLHFEDNQENREKIGVLLHNLVVRTKQLCDDDSDEIIDCDVNYEKQFIFK